MNDDIPLAACMVLIFKHVQNCRVLFCEQQKHARDVGWVIPIAAVGVGTIMFPPAAAVTGLPAVAGGVLQAARVAALVVPLFLRGTDKKGGKGIGVEVLELMDAKEAEVEGLTVAATGEVPTPREEAVSELGDATNEPGVGDQASARVGEVSIAVVERVVIQ